MEHCSTWFDAPRAGIRPKYRRIVDALPAFFNLVDLTMAVRSVDQFRIWSVLSRLPVLARLTVSGHSADASIWEYVASSPAAFRHLCHMSMTPDGMREGVYDQWREAMHRVSTARPTMRTRLTRRTRWQFADHGIRDLSV